MARIGLREWGISLALGVVSIPWGVVIRLMPVRFFEKFFKAIRLMSEPEVLPTIQPNVDKDGWPGAINLIRDNLRTFSKLRGGRLRSSSFVIKSRSRRLSLDKQLTMRVTFSDFHIVFAAYCVLLRSSMLAMGPTLIMGAVAASEAYMTGGSLSDPAHHDPSKSSVGLFQGKILIHPDTPANDPVYKQFGGKENIV